MSWIISRKLHVRLKSWLGHNYSETSGRRYELELYLFFDGDLAHSITAYSNHQHLAPVGFVEDSWHEPLIFPKVRKNKFKVRLVAIERDSPDPDDVASGTIEIDLDKTPPHGGWSVIANPLPRKHLKVEVWFDIEWLEYIAHNDGRPPAGIENTDNHPYPWGEVRLFEHWLGLGKSVVVPYRGANLISSFNYVAVDQSGRSLRSYTQLTYRYVVPELGMAHDKVSSVFVPRNTTVVLHEHAPDDSRFDPGKGKTLRSKGLYNMTDLGFDDMLSTVDVRITQASPRVS